MRKVLNFLKSGYGKFMIIGGASVLAASNSYALDIAAVGSDGDVTFTPSAITTPLTQCIVAAVAASASIFLLVVGVRWIYKFCRH